jgi:hypothetical protein
MGVARTMAHGDLARLDLTWDSLAGDVYFRPDFVALYARPDRVESLDQPHYRHAAALRPIPGSPLFDLETPHGYGGPAAPSTEALRTGLAEWRARQTAAGHVCEFIRFHPFLASERVADAFDHLALDRETVMIDLRDGSAARWSRYTKTVRNVLRRAGERLTVEELAPEQWPVFRDLYHEGLAANRATPRYYYGDDQYRDLLAAPWSTAYVARRDGSPVAASVFLRGPALGHYHLSGQNEVGRAENASYLLIDHAAEQLSAAGLHWLHLGGGRTAQPDDALFLFKSRFSDLRVPFYVGGLIFDRAAFDRLGGFVDGRFRAYRFQKPTQT